MEKEKNTKQFNEIHKRLIIERHTRITVMSFLLSALIFTLIYGTLENPFQYTFSKIGNRFDLSYRIVFIVWATYTGFVIQSSIIALFRLEQYKKKSGYTFIFVSVIFLILTAISPSLDHFPFWTWVHLITGFLFALFLTLGFFPFLLWVAKENPRLRRAVYNWFGVIWGGSTTLFFVVGMTGVFEIFFFSLFIIFLLYLSLSLFEEQIIKRSVNLLQGHQDLNRGIEEIFVPSFFREIKKKAKEKRKQKD